MLLYMVLFLTFHFTSLFITSSLLVYRKNTVEFWIHLLASSFSGSLFQFSVSDRSALFLLQGRDGAGKMPSSEKFLSEKTLWLTVVTTNGRGISEKQNLKEVIISFLLLSADFISLCFLCNLLNGVPSTPTQVPACA